MMSWPKPTTIKGPCGFLDLSRYYWKFRKGYGDMAFPLTAMLKNDGFVWAVVVKATFSQLKEIINHPSILTLPDFTKGFILECDALGLGLRLS